LELQTWNLIFALAVISGAVYLMARRAEVRLVLLGAALLLTTASGRPLAFFDTFTAAMVAEMVAPICAAMGFAAVLTATGCDRHLVRLLVAPLRRSKWLVVPGGILTGYLVNMAIPSQTSTAATLGPILIPLLLAAGVGPDVAGAALVLGASFGGDLLNPAAQDILTLRNSTGIPAPEISARVVPAGVAGVAVAAVVFSVLARRWQGTNAAEEVSAPAEAVRISILRALVPLLPIVLLLVAYGGWEPLAWLIPPAGTPLEGALPVVRAMLIGTLCAMAISWRQVEAVARGLFEGMGAAYASIISLTISARCFGVGIAAIGLSEAILRITGGNAALSQGLAVVFPWALALLSGSGSGPVATFGETFLAGGASAHGSATTAALACLGGAFGRTMSPVAAVVVYSAGLVGLSPLLLVRRLVPALLAGAAVAIAITILRG